MEPDPIETGDSAGKAFDKLRRELTTMRLAVERLADEPAKIVIPDYTETLVEMAANVNAVARGMKALRAAPALELTPETLAKQIADAGAVARGAEQATLASVTSKLVAATRDLLPYVESARTERVQNFWLAAAITLGLAFGLSMGLILPGPIDRAMPESWHWPERAAANVLDRDMWNAGERLQAVADLQRWKTRSEIERMTIDSSASLTACLRAADKSKSTTRCNLEFRPERKGS